MFTKGITALTACKMFCLHTYFYTTFYPGFQKKSLIKMIHAFFTNRLQLKSRTMHMMQSCPILNVKAGPALIISVPVTDSGLIILY